MYSKIYSKLIFKKINPKKTDETIKLIKQSKTNKKETLYSKKKENRERNKENKRKTKRKEKRKK